MTPNDAQALADARRLLRSLNDPEPEGPDIATLTDEQRAERLKRRARERAIARHRPHYI